MTGKTEILNQGNDAKRRMKNNHKRFWLTLTVIILASLSCLLPSKALCILDKGIWTHHAESGEYYCDRSSATTGGKNPASNNFPSGEHQDRNGDSLPEIEVDFSDLTICLPDLDDYALEISNLVAQENSTKRTCSAEGNITNLTNQDMMFATYIVNHYGAEETFGERWATDDYQILSPGETARYGLFFRCTGGSCEEGIWYYIQQISLVFSTEDCQQLVFSQVDKIPESIIKIENPCDW